MRRILYLYPYYGFGMVTLSSQDQVLKQFLYYDLAQDPFLCWKAANSRIMVLVKSPVPAPMRETTNFHNTIFGW